MNKWLLTVLLAVPGITSTGFAASVDITAIFGEGNPDGGWTATTAGDLQLGLRAKNRTDGSTPNVDGTYNFADAPAPRGLWNYEFSINSDIGDGATSLAASPYDFYLTLDTDSSQAFNGITVNALTTWADNEFGNNTTANGDGIKGTALTSPALAATYNIAQNSQNITFAPMSLGLEQNATTTLNFLRSPKATVRAEGVLPPWI